MEEEKPRQGSVNPAGASGVAGSLEQIEFLSAANRCPTVVHAELGVNVFGVGAEGVQGHDQLAGNFRSISSRFRAAAALQAHVRSVARSNPG